LSGLCAVAQQVIPLNYSKDLAALVRNFFVQQLQSPGPEAPQSGLEGRSHAL
jgi:hypothetical protein